MRVSIVRPGAHLGGLTMILELQGLCMYLMNGNDLKILNCQMDEMISTKT